MEISQEYLAKFKEPSVPVRSAHNACINEVLEFMGEGFDQYSEWCGKLSGRTPGDVYALIKKCKNEGRNPQALFNYLIKKK